MLNIRNFFYQTKKLLSYDFMNFFYLNDKNDPNDFAVDINSIME